jgi:putative transposase
MGKVTRFNIENYCHFITSKTHRNAKIFSNEKTSQLLIQTIFEVREKLNFLLIAFVVMPDHVHLMLIPNKRNTISDVVRHIKVRFARKYNKVSRGINSPDYGVDTHKTGNLAQHNKNQIHRVGNSSQTETKVWQESFYDHVIRNRKELVERLNYVYYNPVKAGLVDKPEDYKYSSVTSEYQTDLLGYVGG